MRDLEESSDKLGIPKDLLMENAGFSVANAVSKHVGPLTGLKIVALVGSGNNGSDCLIAGGHLSRWGASVTAIILRRRANPDIKLQEAINRGLLVVDLDDRKENFPSVESLITDAHVILDGILGIGTDLPIRDPLKTFLSDLQSSNLEKANVFAIDVPSGVSSDTSKVSPYSIRPDVTFALGFLKPCHVFQPASEFCGEIEVLNIGLPNELKNEKKVSLLSTGDIASTLPERNVTGHKGTFGKGMILGGSDKYIGAPILAASAALKAGLGLISIAANDLLVNTMASMLTEATFLRLKEEPSKANSSMTMARQIYGELDSYNVLLVGCGLGTSTISRKIFENLLLSDLKLPQLVLDADGLNILSKVPNWWDRLPANSVLTPHPKEMSRLSRLSVEEIQSDRVNVAKKFAHDWGMILVLKGANTVIADPNGFATISPFANPILSSAGTGDVLAGLITGFLGQSCSPMQSACLGVHIHSEAAKTISARIGPSGLLAGDLIDELPYTIKNLRDQSQIGSA
tara:strand:+ start:234 stop:1781 length:1548 start_codon:yes stop_codon:yes gene_type:complete